MGYSYMTMRKAVLDALPGVGSKHVSQLVSILLANGIKSLDDIGSVDVSDAKTWWQVGPYYCSLLKRLGASGDFDYAEASEWVESEIVVKNRLRSDVASALAGANDAVVTKVTGILWDNGIREIGDVRDVDVSDALGWRGVGMKLVGYLKEMGARGEIPEKDSEPFERTKTTCPICGCGMEIGSRVRVSVQWEYSRSLTKWGDRLPSAVNDMVGRSVMMCRRCGGEIAGNIGVDEPKEVTNG